jgi:hypothetical protein
MELLRKFVGPSQMAALAECLRGEEREFFVDLVERLALRIKLMPAVYEQEGNADPVAYLHYFGGSADFWITEKDVERAGEGQLQAFGLADLFGDGGEMGYISIAELTEENIELDFNFTPAPVSQIQGVRA